MDQHPGRRSHRRRSPNKLGRRSTDYDPRTTVTAKVIAGIVFIINALYLVGDTLLNNAGCV